MIGWPRPEVISALALGVSALSLAVSVVMAWRSAAAEKPLAWVKLDPTGRADRWLANIHLRNRSKCDLRAHSVSVPIRAVPITKKQEFWLLKYGQEPVATADAKDVHFKLLMDTEMLVRPGETRVFPVLLIRSPLSDATSVKMTFCMEVMKRRPHFKIVTLLAKVPSASLSIHISGT